MGLFFILIASLIVLVGISVPVGFAIGITGLFMLLITGFTRLQIVPLMIFNSANSFPLLAIPLFMFTGAMLEKSRIGQHMIDFASALVGWVKGGLAMVNVLVSMLFAGMSGSSAADVASIGAILIPEMKRKGYPINFSAAVTSSSACCSLIIPPSINMILYGVSSNTSIARLFVAGIIPGILLGVGQMLLSYFMAVKYDYPVHEPFSMTRVAQTFRAAGASLLIPLVILGGILGGIFTPTESAAVSVLLTAFLGFFVYRGLTLNHFPEILVTTTKRTAAVTFMIACSGLLSWFIAERQLAQLLAAQILALSENKFIILFLINLLLLIVGCLLNGAAAIVLLTPILLPLATHVGIDPIHFGMIMTVNLAIGTQTPPVAGTMLLACLIANISIEEMFAVNKFFILVSIVVLMLVTFFPILVMGLPTLLFD
jgi:C4-dicarboxylate transporter DctM subunit